MGESADSQPAKAEKQAKIRLERVSQWQRNLMLVGFTHEMRGKFVGSRRVMIVAAVAVVAGIVLYFGEVTEKEDDTPAATAETLTPVRVSVGDQLAAKLNRSAGAGCVVVGNQDGLVQGDASSEGPWQIVPVPGEICRPVQFELSAEQGSIAAR